ncbi:MAG: DUF4844 domain-containing protein [Bacteroidota bacterium]|nr:DUF4844 domain-containing protein [Bacteroidota bacterium]
MKRLCWSVLLSCLAFLSHAQAPLRPGLGLVIGRLEDFIEATKKVAETSATAKSQAEARPELNRLLVIAAFDFVQITRTAPGREAYLLAMDHGLERFDPLMTTLDDRLEVAEFYIDLMDIVGLASSDGRLNAFVAW